MELTWIIIAALIIVLPVILTRLLSGKSGIARAMPDSALPGDKGTAGTRVPRDETTATLKLPATEKGKARAPGPEKAALPLDGPKDVVATERKAVDAVRLAPGLVETIRHAQDVSEEVQRLVKKGRKVEAIKLIREQSGMGLKEAKSLVDRLG